MNAKRRRVQVYPSLPPFTPLPRRSNHCTSPSPPHQPHEIAVGGHQIIGGRECEILRSRLRGLGVPNAVRTVSHDGRM